MLIQFHKYQGTGNDFVILDNRDGKYDKLTNEQVKTLCDRRFGIGGDGLMMLNTSGTYDFEMKYYNSDGQEGSMCGNGGRCLVKFAWDLGNRKSKYKFKASDGEHEADLDFNGGIVSLRMSDVKEVKDYHGDFILDTGSPHYVKMVSDVMHYDVFHKGQEIRQSNAFNKEGINVNFVEQPSDDEIIVRTYERGVEDETLSCGTGVAASAIVCYHNEIGFNDVTVKTRGGKLSIQFDRLDDDTYTNIWLKGPAEKVFEGSIQI
jgi:diaminopimelate epimerase